MPGMQIDIGFGGLGEAVNRLREMERLTAQIGRNQAAGGDARAAAGPMARLGAAQRGLLAAGDDPRSIFDAQVRHIRAQQSVERAQRLLGGGAQSTIGQRLMTAVSTSRFGAGGIEPLIGRTAAAIGGEAAAGPIGIAVAAAAGALTVFSQLMTDANRTVGEFRRGMAVTGGTAGQTAALAAMGIAPGEQGQVSAGLRERLVTDSRAMAAAQRIGATLPGHRLAGNVNEAQILRQTLERLRQVGKLEGAERQLFEARELGLEGMIDQLRVSDRLWNAQQRGALVTENIMRRNAEAFREFNGQLERQANAWDNLKTAVGGNLAPGAGEAAGIGATLTNWAARFIEWGKPVFGRSGPLGAIQTGTEIGQKLREWVVGPEQAAMEKNTAALEANTQLTREGMFGGGPRAEGAVPVHLRGRLLGESLETGKLKLGVFGN